MHHVHAVGALATGVIVAAATAGAGGCSATGSENTAANGAAANGDHGVGTVSLALLVQGGGMIDAIGYSLSNGSHTYSGTASAGALSPGQFLFVIPLVAAGSGYQLSLSGSPIFDGGATGILCTGTAGPFAVTNRAITSVRVSLLCKSTIEAGSVLVGGDTGNCATWKTLVATPNSAPTGSWLLTGSATAPNSGALTFAWSAYDSSGSPAGTFGQASQDGAGNDTVIFYCPSTGNSTTVQMVVGDGPLPDGAACAPSDTTASVNVCGSAGGTWAGDGSTSQLYSVGGVLTGLEGGGSIRLSNGTDGITLTTNGAFVFPTMLPPGSSYATSVVAQPTGQSCAVSNATGTVGNTYVTNVSVACPACAIPVPRAGAAGQCAGANIAFPDGGPATASTCVSGTPSGTHDYAIFVIDTTGLSGTTLSIGLTLGSGQASASYDVFTECDQGRTPATSIAHAYDVAPGAQQTLNLGFHPGDVYQLGVEGNWFSTGMTNTVQIAVSAH